MATGLQVWDAGGNLTFDQTTPVVKFLGTATIGWNPGGVGHTGEARSGSIIDSRFTQFAQHVPFWCRIDGGYDNEGYDATWRFDGNSLIWTFPREQVFYINGYAYNRPKQTIIYGIR